MIKVKCTQLEEVRRNPVRYAQMEAEGTAKKGGGLHGIFACVKTAICHVHKGKFDVNAGLKDLQKQFLNRFEENTRNKTKQNDLMEKYVKYHKDFERMKMEFVDGMHFLNWNIHPSVMLTGQTPWIFQNDTGFFAYFLTETYIDNWQSELRFPILQQHLAKVYLDCDPSNLKIGIYSFKKGAFEFMSYNKKHLKTSLTETNVLFQKVNDEFEKQKKK